MEECRIVRGIFGVQWERDRERERERQRSRNRGKDEVLKDIIAVLLNLCETAAR
jgi:hypothetical protein